MWTADFFMTQQDISEYLDKFGITLVQAGHRHEAQIPIKAKSADLKPTAQPILFYVGKSFWGYTV